MKFHKLVGLSGVAADESAAAIRWGKRFEWPMLLVASWIFVQWYLEAAGGLSPRFLRLSDWIVWLFFLVEITANIAAFLVRRDVEKVERKEGSLDHQIKDVQVQLDRIEQSIERLQLRETDGQKVARIRKRP